MKKLIQIFNCAPHGAETEQALALKALWAETKYRRCATRGLVVLRTFENFDDYWLRMVISSPTRIDERLSDAESKELKQRLPALLPVSAAGEITVYAWATTIKGRKVR